ncbi:ABC transporter ATP-binding protein [Micropruina sp.]|uniref:ABC transporter ATP-binding protein n=1 Tax=Micropruina sp. TaxID=2737536 RepID=UPI0039E6ADF1
MTTDTKDDAIVATGVHCRYVTRTRLNLLTGRREPTGYFEAVRGIDLRVARGELFALLGTNGAGKTSTVELIEGLGRPSQGSIRVLGHDPVAGRRHVRHRTGVVLQSSGFPPGLTVGEMARLWHGTLSRPASPDAALAAVGLEARADVETAKLSGGERRRLDIALAVMGRPEVLVLDEPTTGLDPESRRAIWSLVRGLVEQGTAVLLTTHYLEEAEQLANRVAIMHAGLIARQGTVAEIVADAPARISFDRPTDLVLADLNVGLAHITASDSVLIETRCLQPTLRAVLDWAGDTPLRRLEARSASLEQVFLTIADGVEQS